MIKTSQLSALPPSSPALSRHIHIWSAGGDGTVMSVFEMMVQHRIDLDLVFFSCIPFGTGNDISQVLGWGRTTPHRDTLGPHLRRFEALVLERLDKSKAARLDIWQVTMTSHASGHVQRQGPHQRNDGHNVMEVQERPAEKQHWMQRKMCSYVSLGVQGYVGSGFEQHRAGHRWANIWAYTVESAKWLFWRRFPPITSFVSGIRLAAIGKAKKTRTDAGGEQVPLLVKHPIDLVIQNIPHVWGREVDLWGEAQSGLESVQGRQPLGPTDPSQWQPQRANDGRLEVMVISNLFSYLKKLANYRKHVSRIGQFASPFSIEFWPPDQRPHQAQRSRHERDNVICLMCDGEFYEMKDPKAVTFDWCAQIWTLGYHDGEKMGRIVHDEIKHARLN
ncbi:hypothetical protein DM01DRAFT_1363657 [Hesseltinella vesiculosa]|uniref:diacylglycerol kinase (ATP) n=1 Tax=Hesseltinella vesiculosa TaxID=101127 RepID=A0A1X2GC89_9FUNG|nr:hypothetical protein DM01DRAFT_1363657 [Hesseltinella vesiculosa]